MILGIGIDTAEISRMKKACERDAFINKCFTQREIEMLDFVSGKNRCYEMAAGNFAVKEAVSKALGCGMNGLEFSDVEVLRKETGAPFVNISGTALDKLSELKGCDRLDTLPDNISIHVSITNTKEVATAFVILEENA